MRVDGAVRLVVAVLLSVMPVVAVFFLVVAVMAVFVPVMPVVAVVVPVSRAQQDQPFGLLEGQHPRLAAVGAERFGEEPLEVRPDPQDQVRLAEKPRLRRLERVTVRRRPRRDQQPRLAHPLHHRPGEELERLDRNGDDRRLACPGGGDRRGGGGEGQTRRPEHG